MTQLADDVMALRRRLDALRKLVVTNAGPEVLIVDAKELMRDDNDIRYWRLTESRLQNIGGIETVGRWRLGESGSEGSLGEVLWGIAVCYTLPRAGRGSG